MNKNPTCILFAGPLGSSKTPTAIYLSWSLGLSVFSTDAIRLEVLEDILENNLESELISERIDERLKKLISSRKNFIYDASIDRKWSNIKQSLDKNGYKYFIISFDLTSELLEKMASAKRYGSPQELVDKWYDDHQKFIEEHGSDVGLSIKDDTFPNRLESSLVAVKEWINK